MVDDDGIDGDVKMQVPVCRVGDPAAAAVLQSLSLPPTAVTSAQRRRHQAELVPYIRHLLGTRYVRDVWKCLMMLSNT